MATYGNLGCDSLFTMATAIGSICRIDPVLFLPECMSHSWGHPFNFNE